MAWRIVAVIVASFLAVATSWGTMGYAPFLAECPPGTTERSLVRPGSDIGEQEKDWLSSREQNTKAALTKFVQRSKLDFNAGPLISNSRNGIKIGLAFSGGGYRSMLMGAGAVQAMDDRTPGTLRQGHLGGLLQATTYMTALSGSSWLLASLFANNFTTIDELRFNPTVWNLKQLVNGNGPLNVLDVWRMIIRDVIHKHQAGFQVSITDLWGRIMSHQMISSNIGAPGMDWSDIQHWGYFQRQEAPLPIIVTNGRTHSLSSVSLMEATVFEATPWEFGSFDPTLNAFFPTEFLGTRASNGRVPSQESCIRGFDNIGFLIASSSSTFNRMIYDTASVFRGVVGALLKHLYSVFSAATAIDVAAFAPNPFANYSSPSDDRDSLERKNAIVGHDVLSIVDGSEDGQGIALQPLLHKQRGLDVVFAFDNDAETWLSWPQGKAMIATSQKVKSRQVDSGNPVTSFPKVPESPGDFINLGLTSRPVFFGCKKPDGNGPIPPLVVYMANYPYSSLSNTSALQFMYGSYHATNIIRNGYNLMTQLNGTRNGLEDWHECLSCAILQREIQRQNLKNSKLCQSCLAKYCWDEKPTPAAYRVDPRKNPNYYPRILHAG